MIPVVDDGNRLPRCFRHSSGFDVAEVRPEDTTRKIAVAYGLKFTEGEDGMQMHGIVTHVIDQDGRLRARFHGLKFEPVNLVVFINALTKRTQKPHPHPQPGFWDKLKGSLPW